MHRSFRALLTAVAAAATLAALAACTVPPTPSPLLPTRSIAAPSPTPTPTPTPRISVDAAAAAAVRSVQTGTAVSVDDESDGAVWDVRVVLDDGEEQEVHLRASDGSVLAGPSAVPTDADAQSANRALVAAAAITLPAAAERMTTAVPGGRVTAITLETENDRAVWRGDVTNAHGVRQDVRIDAVRASVLLNQTDGATPAGGS